MKGISVGVVFDDVNGTWVNLDWTPIYTELKDLIQMENDTKVAFCLVLDLGKDKSGQKVGIQFKQSKCNDSLNILCSKKSLQQTSI